MRKTIATLALMLVAVVSVDAELKYTMRTSITKAAVAPAADDPMFAMIGDMLVKQLLPNGPADMTYLVGEKGARTEFAQASMGLTEGTVMLMSPTGDVAVLNPKDRTYWRTSMQATGDSFSELGLQPKSKHRRTGEFSTIAGVRAERVTFEWSMDLPIPPDAREKLPPNFPTALSMTGDLWVSVDKYREYGAMVARSNNAMASLGLDALFREGLVLKSVVRSSMFGGQQIETVVTAIREEAAPSGAFEIPAGYRKVPAPAGMGGGE